MRKRLSNWLRRKVFSYVYVPTRLFDGNLDMSVIWNKPKDPTFPYDPELHNFNYWETGIVSFSGSMSINKSRQVDFGLSDSVEGNSKITDLESIRYQMNNHRV